MYEAIGITVCIFGGLAIAAGLVTLALELWWICYKRIKNVRGVTKYIGKLKIQESISLSQKKKQNE